MDIAAWLNGLGLGRYERTFSEHDIGDDVLVDLGGADLEKLGVSLGDRKRLLKALAALRPAAPRDAPEPALLRQAERRQLTVMFVDLVGSTALSRSLDPEDLRDVLGAYQALAARAIERYGGYVAKLLGDGILVYFGWPTAHEDDAERAILAGLALVEVIRNGPVVAGSPLAVRVGIATGLTVVGAFTDGVPEGEAVVGETPNLAARLQALAESNCVVIAASTRRLTRGRFGLADLGARELKGFAEPVSAWRVIGPSDGDDRFAVRAAVGLTQLVGREAELAALVDCWRRSAAGHGQAVVVSGEPGIGKSRLTQALVERLRGEPLTLLYYHCSPHHVQSALWPVVGYLEHAAGFHGGDTPEAKLDKVEALLAHAGAVDPPALSLFATLLELPVPGAHVPHLSPMERRTELLDALVRHLQSLGREPTCAGGSGGRALGRPDHP